MALLHSAPGDLTLWDDLARALSETYEVVRYDSRGNGRSELPPGPFAFHDDLRAVLDFLGIERVALCGLSAGGRTAIDFALLHPDRVDALVLINSGLTGYEFQHRKEVDREFEAALASRDVAAMADVVVRAWFDGPARSADQVDRNARERFRQMCLRFYERALPAETRHLQPEPPAIARLGEIRAPTLVVSSTLDQPDILTIAGLLASGIAGAERITIDGAGHIVNLERPAELSRNVREFLDRVLLEPAAR